MAELAGPATEPADVPDGPAGVSAGRSLTTATVVDRVLLICALVSLPIMLLVPLHATGYWMNLLTQLFIFGILATAWNIIGGYTGYAAFGNVAFFGGGAYVTAELMTRAHWDFLPATLAGGLAMLVYGAVVGVPALRLRGHYFAIRSEEHTSEL